MSRYKLSNQIFNLGLDAQEISVYAYLCSLPTSQCSNQLAAYEEEFTMLYQKTAPGMPKEAMWAAFTETIAQSAAYMALQRCSLDTGICQFKHLQQFGMLALADLALQVRNKQVDKKTANMLSITNAGRKNGLDQRLLNPDLPDEPGTKVNLCVDNVFRIWDETAEQRSTQLIFCDLGVPQSDADKKKNGSRYSVYADIKKKLIAKGIPSEEIAFITMRKTRMKRTSCLQKSVGVKSVY